MTRWEKFQTAVISLFLSGCMFGAVYFVAWYLTHE